MRNIIADNATVLELGRTGENIATQVIFDIADYRHDYPSAGQHPCGG